MADDAPSRMVGPPLVPPPLVGVVVIGRDEGARLVACLRSLAPLGWPVVYVDSGSRDGSQAAARAVGALVVDLDLSRPFTAARARNEGAAILVQREPGLRYIQFVDGDCVVDPAWINTASDFLDASPAHAVACGRRRERHPDASPYNAMADIEWATPVGDAAACGGDSLIRVAAYTAAGGFDPALIAGEEPELCSRLRADGWRIRRLDAAMTIHDAAMTRVSQWWTRAVRSGFGFAQAWFATRHRPGALYRRELLRAAGWTVLPWVAAIAAASLLHPAALLLAPLIYLLQIARLALRFGPGQRLSWQRAALLTLGKLAEAAGAIRFARRALTGSTGGTILYK